MKGKLARLAAITGTSLARTLRSPANLLWMLFLPVAFSFVIALLFSSQGSGSEAVYVVNEDGTAAADALLQGLAATPLELRETTRDQAIAAIGQGAYDVALVIPDGFADSVATGAPTLEVIQGSGRGSSEVEMRARAVAQALASGLPVDMPYVVGVTPRGDAADDAFPHVRGVFGVYLVFVMVTLFLQAASLHRERQAGTLQRVVSTGVPYTEIVTAHVVTIFLVGLVQAALFLTVTGMLGTPWLAHGWVELMLAVLGALFVSSGIAVGLAGMSRSAALMDALAGGLPTVLAMAGGAFFPLEVAPRALQSLARVNPVYWSVEALTGGLVIGSVASQVVPLAVLLLIGTFGMIIGIQGLRRIEL